MSDPLTALRALCAEAERFLGASDPLNLSSGQRISPISVIIPCRDEGQKIACTVRSLVHGRSTGFPLEVVVVDDASTDRSCDILPEIASESPNTSVVVSRLERWSGIPYARNRGAEIAHHPLYLITDANTTYPKNWDLPIHRHSHPDRILAGAILDEQTGNRGYGLSLELPSMGVNWITEPTRYGGYVPVAPCTCTVVHRALFHGLGGYDETLPLYGAAEPEFSVRAWLMGCEIVNAPELLVQHRFRPSEKRSDFHTANQRVLLKNYVRFACSYLPEDVLDNSMEYFASVMGPRDFNSCIAELVKEGIWERRAQLRQVLRHDFAWFSRKFLLNQQETARSVSGNGNSATWTPSAHDKDLMRTLVVIPTFRHHDLTRGAIADCLREPVRIVVVDNSGDYRPVAHEKVVRPDGNLGWLRSNNLAIETELRNGKWDRIVLLNNDVRLSANFFAGLIWAENDSGASIIGASYDDWWASQRPEELRDGQTLEAHHYRPQPRNIPTGACDGTAVSIRRGVLESIGLFDAELFGKYGWSGMTDLCYRARARGLGIIATRAAYVHHIGGGHQTARRVIGDRYVELAGQEGAAGMVAKWGRHWGELRNIPTQAEVDARFPPRIVVYTAMFGDYDQLEPAGFNGVDHICFTDQPDLKVRGWQVRRVQVSPAGFSEDERIRLARRFKLLVQECLPEYQIWIWQDANLSLRRHPTDLVKEYLRDADMATFGHQKRNCIYEEAIACADLGKDSVDKIEGQVGRYRSEGYPSGSGLIWSALIIRRNTPAVRAFDEAWWAELAAGSRRDQLSFNYVTWRFGQRYATMPLEVVSLKPHKRRLHRHRPPDRAKWGSSSGDLTMLLLNWKRPQNFQKVIASIECQSYRPKIFVWNNGERLKDLRVDWIVDSSQNKRCWPRWTLGAMAESEFVCSLDDDFAFGDERVLEDLLHYLRDLDQPDRLVGASGVILDSTKSYDRCAHVKATRNADIPVDIVKGKLLACRRDTLRSIEMVSDLREDDIAVSGLVARGRSLYHRIPALFHDRMIWLPEFGLGLSQQVEHNPLREVARRKYYRY